MRAIDADALMRAMYERAFETDGDTMWQSGCWVRYRAIEEVVKEQPTIEPMNNEEKPKKKLTFSERQKIVREYEDWCLFNNAADCAESFFAYLSIKGFIDG